MDQARSPARADAVAGEWPAPSDDAHWSVRAAMTRPDRRHVPGSDGAEPAQRTVKGAVVLVGYPDEDVVVTKPARSTGFGNSGPAADSGWT